MLMEGDHRKMTTWKSACRVGILVGCTVEVRAMEVLLPSLAVQVPTHGSSSETGPHRPSSFVLGVRKYDMARDA